MLLAIRRAVCYHESSKFYTRPDAGLQCYAMDDDAGRASAGTAEGAETLR